METERAELRALIERLLLEKGDRDPFGDADSLLLSGRMDSLNVLEILSHLETRYAFDLGARHFDQADFDTVEGILNLLATTTGRAP